MTASPPNGGHTTVDSLSDCDVQGLKYLAEHGGIQVDADSGVCSCTTLADVLKPVHFRPEDGSSTCHDRAMNGTCCHLLAAARLPAFDGLELSAGVPVPESEMSVVSRRKWDLPAAHPRAAGGGLGQG